MSVVSTLHAWMWLP